MASILGILHTNEEHLDDSLNPVVTNEVTPFQLKLVAKKIPIKFAEYKISTTTNKMIVSETTGISILGLQFNSSVPFSNGILMRVWVEMPDYWARKSRHVGYRHTDAPTFFQVLSRVVRCEETGKRQAKYQLLCENLNLEPADEKVLNDYLGTGSV
jgi:hypothetical protein